MYKPMKQLSKKAGLPPGSLVYVGEKTEFPVKLTVIDYNKDMFSESQLEDLEQSLSSRDSDSVSWFNVDGLHDIQKIEHLGKIFNLHPLLLEDVLNTKHRPKVEEFDNCIYISLKMISIGNESGEIKTEQVSLVLGEGWVITFQEQEGDIFDVLRDRLRKSYGNIRKRKADYLFYRFIDMVVDHYFFVTEHLSLRIDELEEKVTNNLSKDLVIEIQYLKRQLIELRKMILPLREAIAFLNKESNAFIDENITRYLRDVYEHIIMVNESIDSQKDTVSSIMDLYMSGMSNKMNQVMQVLTIIATIFIPLTFIAGIYGMNFEYIPELKWKYGYFIIWGVMITMVIILLFYFKRKKWL